MDMASHRIAHEQPEPAPVQHYMTGHLQGVDTLINLAHHELVSFRALTNPPEFIWSGTFLMCARPWVKTPILAEWDPVKQAIILGMAIADPTWSKAFQGQYHSNTFASDNVNLLIDGYILAHGLPAPSDDDWRMEAGLSIVVEWIKTHKRKGRRR